MGYSLSLHVPYCIDIDCDRQRVEEVERKMEKSSLENFRLLCIENLWKFLSFGSSSDFLYFFI